MRGIISSLWLLYGKYTLSVIIIRQASQIIGKADAQATTNFTNFCMRHSVGVMTMLSAFAEISGTSSRKAWNRSSNNNIYETACNDLDFNLAIEHSASHESRPFNPSWLHSFHVHWQSRGHGGAVRIIFSEVTCLNVENISSIGSSGSCIYGIMERK